MSQVILPTAGAFVGYLIGNGTGAQIGWMIGSRLAAGNADSQQFEVGDLLVQTAAYGTAIPHVFGKQRCAGNIFWASEKRPYEIKESGKGGSTTTGLGYRVDALIGICAGPILGVSRVWADGDLIVDSTTEVKPLIGQLYLGTSTQVQNSTYAAAVGAADAPAYRGLAYIALSDFDLGVQGRIPNFSFEVLRGAD